ncbi:MAG: helix-turn-helix domain-containing protein [Pseudomonadota bacterium]
MDNQAKQLAARLVGAQGNTDLIDEREAAQILNVAPGTLSVWRCTGRYNLPYVKIGRLVRYSRKALDAWLSSRTKQY